MIKVENLGKSYFLRHRQPVRYVALRDVIVNSTKNLLKPSSQKKTAFEEFWALRDVSFEVNAGDRLGIIGRNGAGKSTLLKILSRIVEPTKGRVTIGGKVASLLEVGTGFHPELTGRENIFLNGAILGMRRSEIKNKLDEIVAFAEVEKFLDTPVKRYSSGMYVRLAFAVAAHLEPEILVVDEVLAVGDASFQKKCIGRMQEVAGEGRTVLFVSHNMDSVQRLCNKGMLLNKGNLILDGNINAVLTKYLESVNEGQLWYDLPPPADAEAQPAFASRLQIENKKGDMIREVPIGDYFQLRVFFTVKKEVRDMVVATGISTLLEQPLRTTWGYPTTLPPGEYEAVFKNDGLILADGQYKVTVGLSSQKLSIHYIENAGLLNISEVSTIA
ncbi:MAG: ABC transporter ATP-binding protein, partial [Crocinitomicaceae bacterium]|nr:ABC transporter ATP-binding protein [Crocinitomicaceae bacterium]